MNWIKYTVNTTAEAEDLVAALLWDLGAEGVEIEDELPPTEEEMEAMYIDPQPELLPELPDLKGKSRVSFYLRPDSETDGAAPAQTGTALDDSYTVHDRLWSPEDMDSFLQQLRDGLAELAEYTDLGEGSIEADVSSDADWRDNWKKYYKPLCVDGILIKPVWHEVPAEYAEELKSGRLKLLEMEPGTAFGTGSHASTRLCLDGLAKYLKAGDTVLDIGTGSGILGIAALLLGAAKVIATELDPACEHVVAENLALNHIGEDRFKLYMGNILEDEALKKAADGAYDVILANILAPVILSLAEKGQADRFAKPGSLIVTSGIIASRAEEVEDAFRANPAWEYLETVPQGDWVSVVARRT